MGGAEGVFNGDITTERQGGVLPRGQDIDGVGIDIPVADDEEEYRIPGRDG